MGEDGYCADQTGYVCGNPVDDRLLDIRGMADTLVPKEKSTVVVQRKKTQLLPIRVPRWLVPFRVREPSHRRSHAVCPRPRAQKPSQSSDSRRSVALSAASAARQFP